MVGDGAADLIGGQGCALLVGLWKDDHEVWRPFRLEEAEGVGVPDRPAQGL